jgi:signal transduction histidine kinase
MERALSFYRPGDRVKARGLVTQFCLSPPYNRYFQLLLSHPMDVETLAAAPSPSPRWLPAVVLLVLAGIVAGWHAQQRNARQNRDVKKLLVTAESLGTTTSAREAADVLRAGLMELIPAVNVELYRFEEERRFVERVPDSHSSTPRAFHLDEASTDVDRALSLALRNRSVLSFADTTKAALLKETAGGAQSILVAPIRLREGTHGAILALGKPGKKLLDESLHGASLHLAADAGEHLDRLEQTALREQLHRSEKLSVAGQLIHGVLTELRAPLESIRAMSQRLGEPEGAAIRREVEKASDTVNRIVSVARAEQMDSRPVALNLILEKLELTTKNLPTAAGIQLSFNNSSEPIQVLGSLLQLQRVFENLLQHAMAAAGHSMEKRLTVNLNRIGRSAMMEIEFSGPFGDGEGPDFSAAALGLAICRGLVQSHGGDVRFVTVRPGHFRYETELPSLSAALAEESAGHAPGGSHGELTVLLVEPEPQSQRKLLTIFGDLEHRLVPVASIQEASDLAERMRFDLVLASTRPEGGTWAELFHRVHHRAPHFAVMTESASMQEGEAGANLIDGQSATLIAKPVEEGDIARLLAQLERRHV